MPSLPLKVLVQSVAGSPEDPEEHMRIHVLMDASVHQNWVASGQPMEIIVDVLKTVLVLEIRPEDVSIQNTAYLREMQAPGRQVLQVGI